MAEVKAFFFFIFFVFLGILLTDARPEMNSFLVQKHLKRLNKPSLTYIQSPDGDIIDCVHMSHQPAFDHPFLKNHTIQMMPNYHPESLYMDSKVFMNRAKKKKGIAQLWHLNGRCPKGTIPVRRTKEEDILRASSVKNYGKKTVKTVPKPKSANPNTDTTTGHEHAIAYVSGGTYYGAKATINVWQPNVEQNHEFSLSQIWILGGDFDSNLNSIEAGWQVSPSLYGDHNTRLFTYWTSDAYQATGCYNLLCSGFIQINSEIAMGASISPLSSNGGSQYDISILVWKDPKDGNWWMQFGKDNVVGYWPGILFSNLHGGASVVEWGGEVVNEESGGMHTTTQMGSGGFPGEGFRKASYVRNIKVVDESNGLRDPDGLDTFTENSNCYDVKLGRNARWGNYFYYGGPGRNSRCP
ncbi:hypothetical protein DM860_004419 [Cuscuta australis]|uniref:Neprosin PEP catalytic domain-containing protein n=1 Tax=Cuscuta australis TaxID=267555 RepID=A0A328EB80_9ASTE|nr:hypothetical protein DM860_004419 [Cuscuta australis]